MTNRSALILLAVVAAIVAADLVLGLGLLVFLGQQFLRLIDVMAFWR